MKNTLLNKAALASGTVCLMTAMMGSAHAEPTGYTRKHRPLTLRP